MSTPKPVDPRADAEPIPYGLVRCRACGNLVLAHLSGSIHDMHCSAKRGPS